MLPAALAAALLLALAVQIAQPAGPPDLPPALAVGAARVQPTVTVPPPAAVPLGLLERPLFAPRRPPAAAAPSAAPPLLGGATVAGVVAIGRRSVAIVREPDGAIRRIAIGGAIAGWRLQMLGTDSAIFRRGRERLVMPYGAASAEAAGDGSGE